MNKNYQVIEQWLSDVVIGLNLCPFAARPKLLDQIDIVISDAQTLEQLLIDLQSEMKRLVDTPAIALETTLLATPNLLQNFQEYNDFLDIADRLIYHLGYEGILQIASFHPDYQFDGTEPDNPENLTNRSPLPIFHLIRELSITEALKNYPDPEQIPGRNKLKMQSLSVEDKKRLFHYLMS